MNTLNLCCDGFVMVHTGSNISFCSININAGVTLLYFVALLRQFRDSLFEPLFVPLVGEVMSHCVSRHGAGLHLYFANQSSIKTRFVLAVMTLSRKKESRKPITGKIHSSNIHPLSYAGPDRCWSSSQLILGKKQVTT